jgi:hypothetical protein
MWERVDSGENQESLPGDPVEIESRKLTAQRTRLGRSPRPRIIGALATVAAPKEARGSIAAWWNEHRFQIPIHGADTL